MRFHKLVLHNIRSYTSASIEFPQGIVLLSGDIGAGKTTVLLAAEFALFGLLRGELPGSALLRHGAQEGSCELTFSIGEKNYIIKRTLKRSGKSVEQDAGYLIVDGVKQVGTATELKSKVLGLLGYPEELLSKGKNLIYRFTVFTPQEQMKQVLFDARDERLALLRKIFDIEKYERIAKNAGSYAKSLRERKRAFELVVSDVREKQTQAETMRAQLDDLHKKKEELSPQLTQARELLESARKQMQSVEEKRTRAETVARELQVAQTQVQAKREVLKRIEEEIAEQLPELPQKIDVSQLAQERTELAKQFTACETSLREHASRISELSVLERSSLQVKQSILSLSQCPTCRQGVPDEHKQQIANDAQQKVTSFASDAEQVRSAMAAVELQRQELKSSIEKLLVQEREASVLAVQHAQREEKLRKKELLAKQKEQVMQELVHFEQTITLLSEEQLLFKDVNEEIQKLRTALDSAVSVERAKALEMNTVEQRLVSTQQLHERVEKELNQKRDVQKKLERTAQVHGWIADYFVPLMSVMEQHVMRKVHHEFDALFQQWFSILIDDTMLARLDESFTPVVQQNGFDVDLESLSGGERTACALAYRLALNKTINTIMSTIQTKDVLILDEPTDGFSAEQLDKMRDVLNQLKLGQIIMVSHEQKIEGLADSIVRVSKSEHISQLG